MVRARFDGTFSDEELAGIRHAGSANGRVRISGDYTPGRRGEYFGDFEVKSLEYIP